MTVLDPLVSHGAPPAMPNVRDLTAALIREQQLSSRLWGVAAGEGHDR